MWKSTAFALPLYVAGFRTVTFCAIVKAAVCVGSGDGYWFERSYVTTSLPANANVSPLTAGWYRTAPLGTGDGDPAGLADAPATGLADAPATGLADDPATGLADEPATGLADDRAPGLAAAPGLATAPALVEGAGTGGGPDEPIDAPPPPHPANAAAAIAANAN